MWPCHVTKQNQDKLKCEAFKDSLTLAVDSDGTIRALTDMQESACDDVTGCAAIHEEQVIVVEAGICEALGVVDLLVEADDGGDVVLAEVWEVGLGGMEWIACIKQKD